LFKLMAGVDILHVPFKGGGPAMVDIVGGHTKVMFSSMVQTVPQIKAGKLRALGTGALVRSPVLPDVPAIAEAGVPGYEAVNWWGVVAPTGTSPAIIDKVNRAIEAVQQSPDVQKQFDNEGATPVSMKPADFGGFMVSECTSGRRSSSRAASKQSERVDDLQRPIRGVMAGLVPAIHVFEVATM